MRARLSTAEVPTDAVILPGDDHLAWEGAVTPSHRNREMRADTLVEGYEARGRP